MAETLKRVGNIELRWTESLANPPVRYPEIVKWEEGSSKPFCFTLCLWRKDKEGWNLEFIGSRPFEYENKEFFWALCKCGQSWLDAEFRLNEEIS